MNFPTEIDGAKVIIITSNSVSNQYGIVGTINDINEIIDELTITAIAICQYEGSKEFYLFSCDAEWEVIGDTVYNTFKEAKESAMKDYNVKENDWLTI